MAEKIKVTFLGTGSAIPTASRNHISVLIRYKEQNILFDCGEGTQRQFKKAKLNSNKITKIFISHWHGDHTLGIPGLLQTLTMSSYNGILEIHGPKGTKQKVKQLIDFHMGYYFKRSKEEGNNFQIEAYDHHKGIITETEEYIISCIPLSHTPSSIAYSFELKEKSRLNKDKIKKLKIPNSPILADLAKGKTINFQGKKIDGKKLIYTEPGRKLTYVFDTRYIKEIENFTKGSDLLMIDSTYTKEEAEIAEKYGHLTSVDAAKIAKKSKTKKLALLHLSQRYDKNPRIIKDQAKEIFKGELLLPKDLDTIEL